MGVIRKALNWYARISPAYGKVSPPYKHVVQIGDPVLRKPSEEVPMNKLKTEEIQNVLRNLEKVLSLYGSVGMSAPQIGANWRIFVMRLTPKQIGFNSKEYAELLGMTPVPYTVFINPKIKVLNYTKVVHTEGCESIRGYSADVPRFREVEVSGYNGDGEPILITFKDWLARIAQHEMDHLNGQLYVDIMDKKTFTCNCWHEVNMSKGKLSIPFYPE